MLDSSEVYVFIAGLSCMIVQLLFIMFERCDWSSRGHTYGNVALDQNSLRSCRLSSVTLFLFFSLYLCLSVLCSSTLFFYYLSLYIYMISVIFLLSLSLFISISVCLIFLILFNILKKLQLAGFFSHKHQS